MSTGRSLLWIVTLSLPVIFLVLLAYLLKDSLPSLDWSQLKIGDLTNLVGLGVGVFAAFIAIASLLVAVYQLQQAITDSKEQRQALDASRAQLKAVVDAATEQQKILSRNLDTSKAQLALLEEQWKRELERQSRKPLVELGLMTNNGVVKIADIPKEGIDFLFEKDKNWGRLVLVITNKGKESVLRPVLRIDARPNTVFVDQADMRIADRANPSTYQFSGAHVLDIEPVEVAGGGNVFTIDITVPESLESFDLRVAVFGKNLPRQEAILHLKVPKPISKNSHS